MVIPSVRFQVGLGGIQGSLRALEWIPCISVRANRGKARQPRDEQQMEAATMWDGEHGKAVALPLPSAEPSD